MQGDEVVGWLVWFGLVWFGFGSVRSDFVLSCLFWLDLSLLVCFFRV